MYNSDSTTNEIESLREQLNERKDYSYSDQYLATEILTYLGISQEPSRESYADRKRDHIAEMIHQHRLLLQPRY